MRTPTSEFETVRQHVINEFGDVHSCCGVFTPPYGSRVAFVEPMQSYDFYEQKRPWGSKNLVDGCVPTGIYVVSSSKEKGMSAHYLDLHPVGGGEIVTVFTGRPESPIVDWRAVRKAAVDDSSPALGVRQN